MHACVNLHLRYCVVRQIKIMFNCMKSKLCTPATAWVTQVCNESGTQLQRNSRYALR
jgi:hypothetical protein